MLLFTATFGCFAVGCFIWLLRCCDCIVVYCGILWFTLAWYWLAYVAYLLWLLLGFMHFSFIVDCFGMRFWCDSLGGFTFACYFWVLFYCLVMVVLCGFAICVGVGAYYTWCLWFCFALFVVACG